MVNWRQCVLYHSLAVRQSGSTQLKYLYSSLPFRLFFAAKSLASSECCINVEIWHTAKIWMRLPPTTFLCKHSKCVFHVCGALCLASFRQHTECGSKLLHSWNKMSVGLTNWCLQTYDILSNVTSWDCRHDLQWLSSVTSSDYRHYMQ